MQKINQKKWTNANEISQGHSNYQPRKYLIISYQIWEKQSQKKSEYRKIQENTDQKKTPYLDNFHAVTVTRRISTSIGYQHTNTSEHTNQVGKAYN